MSTAGRIVSLDVIGSTLVKTCILIPHMQQTSEHQIKMIADLLTVRHIVIAM